MDFDPGAPEAVLLSFDHARTSLAVNAHPNDADQRCVVLVFERCWSATMLGINDEGIDDHRLAEFGLCDVGWLGEVIESTITPMDLTSILPPLRHFIAPLKECVVEMVAESFSVVRITGRTHDAALTAWRTR